MPDWMLGPIFAVIGFALLGAATWMFLRTRAFIEQAMTTVGVVVELVEETRSGRDGNETYFYPVVRFQPASGDEIQFRSNVGSNPAGYRQGEQVPVLYDPAQPAEARIRSFFQLWLLPLVLGFIGAVFAIVGTGLAIK